MQKFIISLSLVMLSASCAQSPVEKVKDTLGLKDQANQLYAKRECSKAIPLYLQLTKEMPTYSESWVKIGNCRVFLKQPDEAVLAYRKAIEIDPIYVKAWHNLAQIQARMLGETVSEMYRNVDPVDPMAVEIRRFSLGVLSSFNLPKKEDDVDVSEITAMPADISAVVVPVNLDSSVEME